MFRALYSLGLYMLCCDAVITIDHPEYWARAWCRVELVFADAGQVSRCTFKSNTGELRLASIEDRISDKTDPMSGALQVEADRKIVHALCEVCSVIVAADCMTASA